MSTNTPQLNAFFYQQPAILDRELHKGLRLQPAGMGFAAKNQAVPLLSVEFPEACLEYPIVFSKADDGQWMALALTGLQANANAFVDAKGQWLARYVPASVRRYPFILAAGEGDQMSLAADLAAPHWGSEGEAIFDEQGEPTERAQQVLELLADFQNQVRLTQSLLQRLDQAQLLTLQNLQVRLHDGHSAEVHGIYIVDEAKLRELPDEEVLAWFRGGELAVVHAHMLSLRTLVPLLERSQSAEAVGTAKAGKKSANKKTTDSQAELPKQ